VRFDSIGPGTGTTAPLTLIFQESVI